MLSRISQAIFATVAVAALLAGCGNGGDESTSTLTKTQFIKQANAICAKANYDQLVAFKKATEKTPINPNSKAGQEKIVVVFGLPPISKAVEELAELGAPSGDEDRVGAIVSGIEDAVKEGEEDPSIVLDSAASPFIPANKLAAAYGLESCAENP